MNIAKNGKKKRGSITNELSTMNLDISTLDIFCKYIVNSI